MATVKPDEVSQKVEVGIEKHEQWAEILNAARKVMLSTEMEEAVKWGTPTYTLEGKNVVGLAAFKNHCALWFHNGAFLKDADKVLANAQEGTTRGLRHWRFEQGDKFNSRKVKAYVKEAIENQRAGKAIKPAPKKTLTIPAELNAALKKSAKLKQAFNALTPGKQREYADHVGSAKQEKTRLSRLEKITPMVLAGQGLNDRYKC